jgi:hypothetical protein
VLLPSRNSTSEEGREGQPMYRSAEPAGRRHVGAVGMRQQRQFCGIVDWIHPPFAGQGNDLAVDTSSFYKPTQAGAYPIVLATYEIVCSKYPDSATGAAVKAFMQTTIGKGQAGLDQYGYIPMPSSFQSKLAAAVNDIS